jgi:type VI secretion system protein ImpE
MNATELFKAGKLKGSIDAQTLEVKASPTDPGRRLFLFELLAFAGDLDRALRQIEAVRYEEPDRDAMVQRYRKLIDSEVLRRKAFEQSVMPSFFIDPPFHLRMRMDAMMNFLPFHRVSEANGLLEGARQMMPTLHVALNDREYPSFHDADDMFGTIIEVMNDGQYYWLPLEQVVSIGLNEPRFPRDLLWFPARVELTDGRTGEVFLPTLYPGSYLHLDDSVKLGRTTDWKTWEGGPVLGIGQKTFLAGEDPVGILEWRELRVLGGNA